MHVQHIWSTFEGSRSFRGHSVYLFQNDLKRENTLPVERNGVTFGPTRGLHCTCKMYLVSEVILWSYGARVSKWPVARQRLAIERNGVKFGTRGSCNMHTCMAYR